MPFTFAHPAIVLPLSYCSRRFVSLSGLVAGSMVPDFEYFLRMRMQSRYSHSLAGMFWYDLPLALLLLFLFHNVVRNSLLAALPRPLRQRLQVYSGFSWNKRFAQAWPVVLLSILIGTASHLLWDSFTHEHGYFVNRLTGLQSVWAGIPAYKLLQHGSSLTGILVISMSILKLPRQPLVTADHSTARFRLITLMATAITAGLRLWCAKDQVTGGHLVVSIMAAAMIGLVVASVSDHKEKGITER